MELAILFFFFSCSLSLCDTFAAIPGPRSKPSRGGDVGTVRIRLKRQVSFHLPGFPSPAPVASQATR